MTADQSIPGIEAGPRHGQFRIWRTESEQDEQRFEVWDGQDWVPYLGPVWMSTGQ